MPIREVLRRKSGNVQQQEGPMMTLCLGGSQGAAALNEAALTLAIRADADWRWVQVSGPDLYDAASKTAERLCAPAGYQLRAFLEADEMAEALVNASLAISRSGAGTVCELALFGVPAIFVPYPFAQGNHQFHNAEAIREIGGASVVRQSDLSPEKLESEWRGWATNKERRDAARESLRNWAIPDAAERTLQVILDTAYAH
jgi:UDP-N-acetylglucosamine--N-acetylmuramyl-(pentapeptide) pyrophosphoryl-undecaprenol N-acetylglucosamine transferase